MEQPQTIEHNDTAAPNDGTPGLAAADEHLVEELLVEEISIDGMCGVY